MANEARVWSEIVKTGGVHGSVFTDETIFQEELERIWYRGWVYVGHESEVPNAHDFVMKSIGPQPIIMTRDREGQVHLLFNRCSHRGNQLCMIENGNARTFTCAYHGWTFSNTGELRQFPFPNGYDTVDKSKLGLGRVPRYEAYRGFVFASLAKEGITLGEHLGAAKEAIDRLVRTSPEGEVQITAGFLKHNTKANWKFIVDNETDGYHPQFVHTSIFSIAKSGIAGLYSNNSTAVSRYLGMGHSENDLRPEFRRIGTPMGWFGTTAERLPEYVAKMKAAYGGEEAQKIMVEGTPHTMIFPNLFIAEIQLFVLQPLAANNTIQHVTALQFKGAPDLNRRMLQQTMGSVGPAGFLLADDSEMYERNQRGVQMMEPAFTFLERGVHRERDDSEGFRIGDATDEVPSRGMWSHYRHLMESP